MKTLIVSSYDNTGGAAIAALRLTKALRKRNIDTNMLVSQKKTDLYYVKGAKNKFDNAKRMIRPTLSSFIQKFQKKDDQILHSGNWFPSNLFKDVQRSDVDIINIHWVNGEGLSIKEIGKVKQPKLMTLHDMWAFCGSEHLSEDLPNSRFRLGYSSANRDKKSSGIDLDRLVWQRKRKYWSQPFPLVTPSNWLAKCVRDSVLFSGWPVHVIPNPIDTNIFRPIDKKIARTLLGLPLDKKLIGFGAWGGSKDFNKGFDLLEEALFLLSKYSGIKNIECVIFGQSQPRNLPNINFNLHYLGHLNDDVVLALMYNALDLIIVPSRIENLPQTITESHSCGIPAIAFDTGGISDCIDHMKSGILVKPFSCEDMAKGIYEIVTKNRLQESLSYNARKKALTLWSNEVVADKYTNLYQEITNDVN